MKLALFGATGMVGQGVLLESLDAADVVEVVSFESKGLEKAASTMMANADATKQFSDVVARAANEASTNVNSVADAAGEQFGELEDGRRHLAVAIEACDLARGVHHMREAPELVG